MNTYFVSYYWKTFFRKGIGFGIVDAGKGMETMDGILDVMAAIKEEKRFSRVVILNFKKLGENDD